jgi:hypothetical protein
MKLIRGITFCLGANGAIVQAVNLTNGRELSITSTVTDGCAITLGASAGP